MGGRGSAPGWTGGTPAPGWAGTTSFSTTPALLSNTNSVLHFGQVAKILPRPAGSRSLPSGNR